MDAIDHEEMKTQRTLKKEARTHERKCAKALSRETKTATLRIKLHTLLKK